MLQRINKHGSHQVLASDEGNKEHVINWRKYVTRLGQPYFDVSWQWLNQLLAPVSKTGVFRLISSAWNKLQKWMHYRGKWMFFKPPEQYQLLTWVQSLVTTRSVTNFKEDWKDGIVLCALIEGISPGACPRYDVLHPKQEQLNIELGLRLAESHLGLFSELTPTEILNMDDKAATKLQNFVAELFSVYKMITGMNPKPCCLPLSVRTYELQWNEDLRDQPTCFAKGMGLLMAAKGKTASFNIYLQTYEYMDIVIEIKGRDNDDYCTERITLRSPRKKEMSNHPFDSSSIIPLTTGHIIPLEYEILSRKIVVAYVPPSAGLYDLSIISRGQHIFGSPFEVRVESTSDAILDAAMSVKPLLNSFLPRQDSDESDVVATNELSSIFLKNLDTNPPGLVKKRRLIKTTVLREYAMIELKPGEPLPQDPRAWSALTNGPAILLNRKGETQRVELLAKQICCEKLQQHACDAAEIVKSESIGNLYINKSDSLEVCNGHNAEKADNTKFDYESPQVTVSELNERESQGIESTTSTMTQQGQQHNTHNDNFEEKVDGSTKQQKINLDEDTEVGSEKIEQHKMSEIALRIMEKRRSYSFRRNNESKSTKELLEQFEANYQNSTTSPESFRHDPEGLEGKGSDDYLEIETFRSIGQGTSEIAITPSAQLRGGKFNAPNSKAGREPAKGSALPRVPKRLIEDWTNLWSSNGTSIVKARVKEWEENLPKNVNSP